MCIHSFIENEDGKHSVDGICLKALACYTMLYDIVIRQMNEGRKEQIIKLEWNWFVWRINVAHFSEHWVYPLDHEAWKYCNSGLGFQVVIYRRYE